MSFRLVRTTCAFFLCFFLLPLFTQRVCAQAPAGGATGQAAAPAAGATGGLTGFVTDPSGAGIPKASVRLTRSEEHTSELQSRLPLVCRLLLEKKKVESHQPNGTVC